MQAARLLLIALMVAALQSRAETDNSRFAGTWMLPTSKISIATDTKTTYATSVATITVNGDDASGELYTLKGTDPKLLVKDPKTVQTFTGKISGNRIVAVVANDTADGSGQKKGAITIFLRRLPKPADDALSVGLGMGGYKRVEESVQIALFDANPEFNDYKYLGASGPPLEAQKAGVNAAMARKGACADGVSLLIVRVNFKELGTAAFTLEGENAGFLSPIDTDLWAGIGRAADKVETVKKDSAHFALALYQPPKNFGAGAGPRKVTVKVTLTPSAANGKAQTVEGEIAVSRPPVLLVHGTYDSFDECWKTTLKEGPHKQSMFDRLAKEGMPVFGVNWKETNGMKDPSSFATNEKMVWDNGEKNGGIKYVLDAMRAKGFAATQADLVCHSQGGVLARMYTRGITSWDGEKKAYRLPRDEQDIHYTDPLKCCYSRKCWYHRASNFGHGDIHRLITVSSTHMGSDLSGLLSQYIKYKDDNYDPTACFLSMFFLDEVNASNGIYSDGFRDQIPNSPGLNAIGSTRVPSHAIACVCDDNDMATLVGGYYQQRLEKIWNNSPLPVLKASFEALNQSADFEQMKKFSEDEAVLEAEMTKKKNREQVYMSKNLPIPNDARYVDRAQDEAQLKKLKAKHAQYLRSATFGNTPSDCTVRRESSLGKLPEQYTTTIPHVLHGFAPQFKAVQDRVVELLNDRGQLFCESGFPNAAGPTKNLPPSAYQPNAKP